MPSFLIDRSGVSQKATKQPSWCLLAIRFEILETASELNNTSFLEKSRCCDEICRNVTGRCVLGCLLKTIQLARPSRCGSRTRSYSHLRTDRMSSSASRGNLHQDRVSRAAFTYSRLEENAVGNLPRL